MSARNLDYGLSHLISLTHLTIAWSLTGPRLLDAICLAPLEVCMFIGAPTRSTPTGTNFADRLVDGVSFSRLEELRFKGMPEKGYWSPVDRCALVNACFKSVSLCPSLLRLCC
jgi:hypothetical protein